MPTVKLAEDAPAAILTVEGTVALETLEDKVIDMPPVGAGPLRLTVPTEGVPPTTIAGVIETPDGDGGLIVSFAVSVTPFREAVIVAVDDVDNAEVVIVKLADSVPPGTVTDVGVKAIALLDDRLTMVPPEGAGLPR